MLIRRFDPTNEHHWSVDEENGEPRIRSGAFQFDDEPNYGGMGCSVFQESLLVRLGHSRWVVIEEERPHFAVAMSEVQLVRAVTRESVSPTIYPFEVVEAPDAQEVPGVAHALIVHANELSKPSRWYRELDRVFNSELRTPA